MHNYQLTDESLQKIHESAIDRPGKSLSDLRTKKFAVDLFYQEMFVRYINETNPEEKIALAGDLEGLSDFQDSLFIKIINHNGGQK